MNKSNDYMPINLSTIRVDTAVGCDLYLENRIHGTIQYVLYCSRLSTIRLSKIEELQKHNVKKLFIRKGELKAYLLYAESNLKSIIRDDKVDVQVKTEMVYDVAKSIMIDIFGQPCSREQLLRSKVWITNVIDFAMMHEDVFSNIVNLISYDYTTYSHSVNVSIYGLLFAKYVGFERDGLPAFTTGLLLHDIGKTQIEPEIVNKKSRLNKEEFARIKMHVELGAEMIIQADCFESTCLLPVMQHHEKCNGMGYPKGLFEDSIHKYGKMATIIDVYDALTTRRPYSDARKPFPALTLMADEMKGSFDTDLLKHFISFLGTGGIKQTF